MIVLYRRFEIQFSSGLCVIVVLIYPLKTLKSSNSLYDDLISYRTYRLKERTNKRTGKDTAKVRHHMKMLEIEMNDQLFIGEDPVQVFNFLADLTEECYNLDKSEAQAFLALPYLLKLTSKEQ